MFRSDVLRLSYPSTSPELFSALGNGRSMPASASIDFIVRAPGHAVDDVDLDLDEALLPAFI